jgi:hypothetical protein
VVEASAVIVIDLVPTALVATKWTEDSFSAAFSEAASRDLGVEEEEAVVLAAAATPDPSGSITSAAATPTPART